jgi:hypothetical protein
MTAKCENCGEETDETWTMHFGIRKIGLMWPPYQKERRIEEWCADCYYPVLQGHTGIPISRRQGHD